VHYFVSESFWRIKTALLYYEVSVYTTLMANTQLLLSDSYIFTQWILHDVYFWYFLQRVNRLHTACSRCRTTLVRQCPATTRPTPNTRSLISGITSTIHRKWFSYLNICRTNSWAGGGETMLWPTSVRFWCVIVY